MAKKRVSKRVKSTTVKEALGTLRDKLDSESEVDANKEAVFKWIVSVKVDCKYVTFKFKTSNGGCRSDYWFYANQCCTHAGLVKWITHLSEKNWFDIKLMRSFIAAVCSEFDLEMY